MKGFLLLAGVFAGCAGLFVSGPAVSSTAKAAPVAQLTWKSVQPGLELARDDVAVSDLSTAASEGALIPPRPDTAFGFIFVRIDPSRCAFSLHMASEDAPARSLEAWASRHDLVAAINAGMYLPNNLTSTGYMRGPAHMNQGRMGAKLGAFFVANPKKGLPEAELMDLPQADIIERGDPLWQERLDRYSLVIQNYRLISRDGRILWPEGGAEHSIAAVGRDTAGRIVFILCGTPMTPARFAARLQRFPLSLNSVMYVEGGAQAGLFLRDQASAVTWMGRLSILNTQGSPDVPLPNIIGVRSREPQ